MSWSIAVDDQTCIGSGMCAGVAPDHFELLDGYSQPRSGQVEPSDDLVEAAESCPVEAILVKDGDTGKVVAPEE